MFDRFKKFDPKKIGIAKNTQRNIEKEIEMAVIKARESLIVS
jgi:hypothetical protein